MHPSICFARSMTECVHARVLDTISQRIQARQSGRVVYGDGLKSMHVRFHLRKAVFRSRKWQGFESPLCQYFLTYSSIYLFLERRDGCNDYFFGHFIGVVRYLLQQVWTRQSKTGSDATLPAVEILNNPRFFFLKYPKSGENGQQINGICTLFRAVCEFMGT